MKLFVFELATACLSTVPLVRVGFLHNPKTWCLGLRVYSLRDYFLMVWEYRAYGLKFNTTGYDLGMRVARLG